ncbi:hypothetical protein [uncultured Shewanella sp.]|nr:hypothetical protein [uncultured Shewanella sp.]
MLTDIIPLAYHISPDAVLDWRNDEALRRYHLAVSKLGMKNS